MSGRGFQRNLHDESEEMNDEMQNQFLVAVVNSTIKNTNGGLCQMSQVKRHREATASTYNSGWFEAAMRTAKQQDDGPSVRGDG